MSMTVSGLDLRPSVQGTAKGHIAGVKQNPAKAQLSSGTAVNKDKRACKIEMLKKKKKRIQKTEHF